MTSENAGRPPQLLGEHDAGEEMRPGHHAEAEQQIGLRARGIAMAVGRADQEARLAHALVAPAAEQASELFGGQQAPAFIEQNLARGCQRRR